MTTRVVFFGDSFVNGTGDPDCLGWAGRICRAARGRGHDVTYYNLGVRRHTSIDVERRWRFESVSRLPKDGAALLLFSFGVNDCLAEGGKPRASPEETLRAARRILDGAAKMADVLMIGPPPIADTATNRRVEALDRALGELCSGLHVPYLGVFARLISCPTWMAEVTDGDGAHPSSQGYQQLAAIVDSWDAWRHRFPSEVKRK